MTTAREPDVADPPFRPRRVALLIAVVVGLGLAIDAVSARSSFVDGVAFVVLAAIAALASTRLPGLLSGTVPHTAIAPPPGLSERLTRRLRAATPCAIVSLDGVVVAAAILFLTDGHGEVASALMFAAGSVAMAAAAAGCCVGLLLRPRLLMPATMRSRRSS